MPGKVSGAAVDATGNGAFFSRSITTQFECRGNAFFYPVLGNPIIDNVNNTTSRGAAIKERGGAANNFDTIGKNRFDRHAVIRT